MAPEKCHTSTNLFQSRNRETFDSNLMKKVLIVGRGLLGFQSRNRETFDSNNKEKWYWRSPETSFNLVIEKLLIPTTYSVVYSPFIFLFQSRNRETFDSNGSRVRFFCYHKCEFQSRNRETFDSNSPLSEPLRGLL